MKTFLEFDDPGAQDDERAKGVTVGDIRAWNDQYDRLLSSWAECRALLSEERARVERIETLLDKQKYENSALSVGQVRRSLMPNPAQKKTS